MRHDQRPVRHPNVFGQCPDWIECGERRSAPPTRPTVSRIPEMHHDMDQNHLAVAPASDTRGVADDLGIGSVEVQDAHQPAALESLVLVRLDNRRQRLFLDWTH